MKADRRFLDRAPMWMGAFIAGGAAAWIVGALVGEATRPEAGRTLVGAAPAVTAVAPEPPAANPPATNPPATNPPAPEPPEVEPPYRVPEQACALSRLGPGYERPTDPAAAAELRRVVAEWIADRDRPVFAQERGIAFIQSAEDRGDDPPYPRSAGAEAQRVCGSAAGWLRETVRHELAGHASYDGLVCHDNVCCYGGSEYAPTGYVVFQPIEGDGPPAWRLDAWIEIYEAALGDEVIAANHRDVARAMRRLRAIGCPGEAARYD